MPVWVTRTSEGVFAKHLTLNAFLNSRHFEVIWLNLTQIWINLNPACTLLNWYMYLYHWLVNRFRGTVKPSWKWAVSLVSRMLRPPSCSSHHHNYSVQHYVLLVPAWDRFTHLILINWLFRSKAKKFNHKPRSTTFTVASLANTHDRAKSRTIRGEERTTNYGSSFEDYTPTTLENRSRIIWPRKQQPYYYHDGI